MSKRKWTWKYFSVIKTWSIKWLLIFNIIFNILYNICLIVSCLQKTYGWSRQPIWPHRWKWLSWGFWEDLIGMRCLTQTLSQQFALILGFDPASHLIQYNTWPNEKSWAGSDSIPEQHRPGWSLSCEDRCKICGSSAADMLLLRAHLRSQKERVRFTQTLCLWHLYMSSIYTTSAPGYFCSPKASSLVKQVLQPKWLTSGISLFLWVWPHCWQKSCYESHQPGLLENPAVIRCAPWAVPEWKEP